MQLLERKEPTGAVNPVVQFVTFISRIALAILIPVIAFFVLYQGFIFLRAGNAPKWFITLVAIVWGVGGTAILYWIFNWLVEMLSDDWTARLQPFVFIGPAMAILSWYLALPALRTLWISLFSRDGPPAVPLSVLFTAPADYFAQLSTRFVGLDNYCLLYTSDAADE